MMKKTYHCKKHHRTSTIDIRCGSNKRSSNKLQEREQRSQDTWVIRKGLLRRCVYVFMPQGFHSAHATCIDDSIYAASHNWMKSAAVCVVMMSFYAYARFEL